jgi:hypothetical protein
VTSNFCSKQLHVLAGLVKPLSNQRRPRIVATLSCARR